MIRILISQLGDVKFSSAALAPNDPTHWMLESCAKDFQRCLAWYSGDSMLLKYLAHFTSKSAIVRGIRDLSTSHIAEKISQSTKARLCLAHSATASREAWFLKSTACHVSAILNPR